MDAAKSRLSHGRWEFASMWVLQCRPYVLSLFPVQLAEGRKGKSQRKSCLALVQIHNRRRCICQRDVPKRLECIWEKASMLSLVHSCFDGIPEKERVLESEFSAHWPLFSRALYSPFTSRLYLFSSHEGLLVCRVLRFLPLTSWKILFLADWAPDERRLSPCLFFPFWACNH